jgi:hypothetical protein
MTSHEQHVLARAVRDNSRTDREEHLFKQETEPQIASAVTMPTTEVTFDHAFGPQLSGGRWVLGNVYIDYDDENMLVGNKNFHNTPGLQQLIFYKNPREFR